MFETKGRLDEKVFNEVYIRICEKWRLAIFLIVSVVTTCLSIRYLVLGIQYIVDYGKYPEATPYTVKWFLFSFLFLALAVLYMLVIFVIGKKKYIKKQIGIFNEVLGTEYADITVSFDDEGVIIKNDMTEKETKIKYEHFDRFIKTKNYYVLGTKAKQCVVIFKNQLSNDEKESLFEFLEKKTNIINYKMTI